MKRDISVYIPDLSGGGAERMMINLTKEFATRGYDVDLVLSQKTGPYLSDVDSNVNVVDLDIQELPGYAALGALPSLVQYLRKQQPTSFLSVLTRVNVVSVLASRLSRVNTRVVVSERNHLSSTLDQYGTVGKHVLPKLVRLTYPWADGIIPISNGVAEDLNTISGVPVSEMTVVHNPAYTEEIRMRASEPVSHPWFTPDEPPVIIGVGSLSPQKDFATLIKAFDRLQSRRDTRLLILGEGEQRKELESLIEQYELIDCVDLLGFVDNPFKYMKQADVFVLSSQWEGFGNVVVEALACGTPVVSTDCPSGPAEILQNGMYGRLVAPGDADALAAAVEATLDDPPMAEPLIGRAKTFSVERIADQYLDVLLPERTVEAGRR